jgi:hypothetical protein
MIFFPDLTQSLHCIVDADFAGLWNVGDAQDPMLKTPFL